MDYFDVLRDRKIFFANSDVAGCRQSYGEFSCGGSATEWQNAEFAYCYKSKSQET